MGFQIKKLIGLGLVGGMVLKKFGSMLLNMPRQLLRTTFKIQKEMVYFPLRLINAFYRLLCKQTNPPNITCNCTKTLKETSERESVKIESPFKKSGLQIIELEPVYSYRQCGQGNVDWDFDLNRLLSQAYHLPSHKSPRKYATNKFLQPKFIKTAESGNKDNEDDNFEIPEFSKGSDHIRYSEIMTRKSSKLIEDLSNFAKSRRSSDEPSSKCLSCKKERFVQESTLAGIEELFNKFVEENSEATKSVKRRHHKEILNHTCNSNAKSTLTEAVPTIKKVISELDCQEKASDIRNLFQNSKHAKMNKSSRTALSQAASGAEDTLHNAQQKLNLYSDALRDLIDVITREIISLKHGIVSTSSKMEEVNKSSFILFEELSQINERFNRLINLSNKIMYLQRELNEGHKLFQEVEADRNDMLQKLQALERMIKEEEEFLRDVSCESARIPNSSNPASPCRHFY